jgi:hypothetical protein
MELGDATALPGSLHFAGPSRLRTSQRTKTVRKKKLARFGRDNRLLGEALCNVLKP